MGCRVCRGTEPEAQLDFVPPEPKNSNHIIIEPKKESPEHSIFLQKFDEKLPYIGKYIPIKDFESVIPENAHRYMTEKTIEIPNNIYNIKNYEIKPVEFTNGNNIYQGGWNENFEMEGYGKYYLKDEKVLAEGFWKNGELLYARVFLPNGDIYEGEIKESKFNGKGKLKNVEGDFYEGDFLDGQKTGFCKIIFADNTIYEGGIEKGLFNGKGNIKYINGIEYDGNFSGSTFNGYGKIKNNEECYEGNFDNNLFHGKGKYKYKNGDEYYGNYEWGVKKGRGVYNVGNKFLYDGDWNNDLQNGYGKIKVGDYLLKSTWRNGKIIEYPNYENGNEEDFKNVDCNFVPQEMSLVTKDLPHLEKTDIKSSLYKLGSVPSFFNE